jgi:hypothetical protein
MTDLSEKDEGGRMKKPSALIVSFRQIKTDDRGPPRLRSDNRDNDTINYPRPPQQDARADKMTSIPTPLEQLLPAFPRLSLTIDFAICWC